MALEFLPWTYIRWIIGRRFGCPCAGVERSDFLRCNLCWFASRSQSKLLGSLLRYRSAGFFFRVLQRISAHIRRRMLLSIEIMRQRDLNVRPSVSLPQFYIWFERKQASSYVLSLQNLTLFMGPAKKVVKHDCVATFQRRDTDFQPLPSFLNPGLGDFFWYFLSAIETRIHYTEAMNNPTTLYREFLI